MDCEPDAGNSAEKDASLHRWYKGNCSPYVAAVGAVAATEASYTKVVYSDSTCLTTVYPWTVAAETLGTNACTTVTTTVGTTTTTAYYKYFNSA